MLNYSINSIKSTFSILRYSYQIAGIKSFAVIFLLLFAAFAETFGILTIFPFLNTLMFPDLNTNNSIMIFMDNFFELIGLKKEITSLLIFIILFLVIKTLLTIIAMNYVGFISNGICTSLRINLINNFFSSKWDFFSDKSVGGLVNSVSSEVERSTSAFIASWNFLSSLIHALIFLFSAIFISLEVSLISILIGILIFLILNGVMKVAKKAGDNQTTFMKSLLSSLTDYILGIKPLKAMNEENNVIRIIEKDNFSLLKALNNVVISSNLIKHLPQIIILFFLGITIYYALNFTNIELTLLAVLALLFNRILSRISLLQKYLQTVTTSESAFWSIKTLIDQLKENEEKITGSKSAKLVKGITLRDIEFNYDKKVIFKKVNMFIPQNKITAIIGKSGIGKTTIVDLIIGLREINSGEILIGKDTLSEINVFNWRKKISYVPQDTVLFNDSVFNNITLKNSSYSKNRVLEALKKSSALDFVNNLPDGINSIVGERGMRLSGGQKQRLSIARAIIRNPSLIVFDESTTSLDHDSENEICKLIKLLSRSITIIAISHQGQILKYADRVYEITGMNKIKKKK